MANTVFKLRRSSVAGKVPNTSALGIGELAINLTDRKLFSTDGTTVFETGANLTTLTVSTNTSVNNIIITGSVQANGGIGTNGQILISNGSSVYWGLPSSNGILDIRQQYTGNGSQNTFVVTGGYRNNDLSVFLNGTMLRNGVDVNVTDGSTVKFTTAPVNGSLIDVVGVGTLYANGISSTTSQQFTANGTANSFTISGGYVPSQIQVYLNGVKQVPGTDVIITSGNTVNFINTPGNNYIVDVFGYQTSLYTYVNTDAQYTWTNTQTFSNTITFNSTIVGTVNNALYLGGTVASGYQTTAGLSANVATLTSNNTSYVGTVTAANVVSNAQLVANLANYALLSGGLFTGSVNATSHTVGTSTIANSIGVYTGIVNAASHTVGSIFVANASGVYHSVNTFNHGTLLYGNGAYVGIGTSTPAAPLDAQSTQGVVSRFLFPGVANGGLVQIIVGKDATTSYAQGALTYTYNSASPSGSYFSLGNSTTNSGMFNVLGNGYVGIGTTTPVEPFQVKLSGSNNNFGVFASTLPVAIGAYNDVFNAWGSLQVGLNLFSMANGNVGIGTSTPITTTHIYNPSNDYTLLLQGGFAGNANDGGGIFFATAFASAITSANNAASSIRSLNAYASESNGEEGHLVFYTNKRTGTNTYTGLTERMRIASNGSVGIGNTSPGYQLTVQTSTQSGHIGLTGSNQNAMQFLSNTGTSGFIIGRSLSVNNNNDFFIYDAAQSTNRFAISNTGCITYPSQPAFRAYLGTAADTTFTINTILPFNTTAYNRGNNFNTSTYLFTAPIAGIYYFHAFTYGTSSGGAATMAIKFYVNGSVVSNSGQNGDVNIGTGAGQVSIAPISGSTTLNLAAGDTVGCYCTAYNNTSIFRVYTGQSCFEGWLLG